MLDRNTLEKLDVAEDVALALNAIGIRPVLSGAVGLKLCLSRHTNGRIDGELAGLPVDSIDMFVPASCLTGSRWEGLMQVMALIGFSRKEGDGAGPYDFVSDENGQVVSFADESWPEMGIGPGTFVANGIGMAHIRTMPIDMYDFLYERLLTDDGRISCRDDDRMKLDLVRRANAIADGTA